MHDIAAVWCWFTTLTSPLGIWRYKEIIGKASRTAISALTSFVFSGFIIAACSRPLCCACVCALFAGGRCTGTAGEARGGAEYTVTGWSRRLVAIASEPQFRIRREEEVLSRSGTIPARAGTGADSAALKVLKAAYSCNCPQNRRCDVRFGEILARRLLGCPARN